MLKINTRYRICAFKRAINKPYRHKLLAMGMLPGKHFTVIRYAPLGDTIKIEVNDFLLSLRHKELQHLVVEELIDD